MGDGFSWKPVLQFQDQPVRESKLSDACGTGPGFAPDFDQARHLWWTLPSQPTTDGGNGHTLLPGELVDGMATLVKMGHQVFDLLGCATNIGPSGTFRIHDPIVAAKPPMR